MAKKYDLEKSKATGGWTWTCKDRSNGGTSPDKSTAKEDAKAACGGSSKCVITPPVVDLTAHRGYLSHFTILNLDDKPVTFSTGEISESEFSFYFGLPCAKSDVLTDERKAIVILTILGIYRGGYSIEQLKKNHNLSDINFKKLIKRQYHNGEIIIENNEKLIWKL